MKRFAFILLCMGMCSLLKAQDANIGVISTKYSKGEVVCKEDVMPPIEKPVDENRVFDNEEQMPQFPGGNAALFQYVNAHLIYPETAIKQKIQGKCLLQFVVTKTGEIGKVKVVRSLSPECDAEAIRVVRSLPKFTPGKLNGKPVDVWYSLPFTFKLKD
ncbi:MAG: energy transducer TonB [Sodaliphilus sp.]